jgi:hypothetical protein
MDNLRNEVKISLAGEERTMRASFEVIVAIESATGKSMTALINQIANGDMSVTEAATIVHHGLRGFDDRRLSYQEVGNAVVEAGLGNVSIPIVEFVSKSLNGVSVGKPQAAAA